MLSVWLAENIGELGRLCGASGGCFMVAVDGRRSGGGECSANYKGGVAHTNLSLWAGHLWIPRARRVSSRWARNVGAAKAKRFLAR